jgi:hypothetical protein
LRNERSFTNQVQNKNNTNKGAAKMTEMKNNLMRNAIVETKVPEEVECEPLVQLEATETIAEEKAMFELENDVLVEFGDRTFRAEFEVERFLATLTEAQLAEAEVLVDDDTFVVFYPILNKRSEDGRRSGHHFDLDCPRPTVAAADVPELVGVFADQSQPFNGSWSNSRDAALAVLLASVRL